MAEDLQLLHDVAGGHLEAGARRQGSGHRDDGVHTRLIRHEAAVVQLTGRGVAGLPWDVLEAEGPVHGDVVQDRTVPILQDRAELLDITGADGRRAANQANPVCRERADLDLDGAGHAFCRSDDPACTSRDPRRPPEAIYGDHIGGLALPAHTGVGPQRVIGVPHLGRQETRRAHVKVPFGERHRDLRRRRPVHDHGYTDRERIAPGASGPRRDNLELAGLQGGHRAPTDPQRLARAEGPDVHRHGLTRPRDADDLQLRLVTYAQRQSRRSGFQAHHVAGGVLRGSGRRCHRPDEYGQCQCEQPDASHANSNA